MLACTAAITLENLQALDRVEALAWDWRVRLMARPGPATRRVRLILIDQSSLDWATAQLGLEWPWPRQAYEPLLAFCRRSQARSVVLDLLFTEPSSWGVKDDQAFARALATTTGVVVTAFLSNTQGAARHLPPGFPDPGFRDRGFEALKQDAGQYPWLMSRAALPVPDIAAHAAVIGNVSESMDSDAVIRRIAPCRVFDGRVFPNLGLAAWLAAEPEARLVLRDRALNAGAHTLPLDPAGNVIPRFRGPSQTHKAVNAAAVIQSELRFREGKAPTVDTNLFKNAYVFVGVTAPALLDLRPTPVSSVYPGVEVHATLLDNLLSGDLLREASPWLVVIWTVVFSIVCGVAGRLAANGMQACLSLGLMALPPAMALAAYAQGTSLSIAVPEAGGGLALLAALVVNYALEGRQKRFIRNAFKQYLSPEVIDRLVRDPGKLTLGGEERELSIFFSDIQGFTAIAETLSPTALTELLNEYLTAVTRVLLDQGGTVDKYEGDAVIAFWNAPSEQRDHPVRAVRAALHCQAELARRQPAFRARAGTCLCTRIGIHTGRVVVGNLGSDLRFDYTFLGDAGNLAARLEGVNKVFGTRLLISEATWSRLAETFPAREISRIRVVGRSEPVRVYEPMLASDWEQKDAVIKTFTGALGQYYAGDFEKARQAFLSIGEQDPPAAAYARRCARLAERPPAPWHGVWDMTEK